MQHRRRLGIFQAARNHFKGQTNPGPIDVFNPDKKMNGAPRQVASGR